MIVIWSDELRLDRCDAASGLKSDEHERRDGFGPSIGMSGLPGGLAAACAVVVTESTKEVVDERLKIRQADAALCTSALDGERDLLVVSRGDRLA